MTRKKVERLRVPSATLSAELAAVEGDDDGLTFEVVFYSGAEVPRYPIFDEPYLLSMSMDPKHVRMDRINAGAAVTKGHDTYSGPESIVGVTSDGRIEDGLAKAKIRLSGREDVKAIAQDIRDGILRNVSMGVNFHELTELEPDEATGMPRVMATDWEPNHIGLVAVPADAGAQVQLAAEDGETECRFVHRAEAAADAHRKENQMDKITVRLLADCDDGKLGEIVEILEADFDEALHSKDVNPPKAGKRVEGERETPEEMQRKIDETLEADKKRAAAFKRIAVHYDCDDLWVQRQINLGASVEEAVASASKERSKRSPRGPSGIGIGDDFDSAAAKAEFMAEAVVARAKGTKPGEGASRFAGMSFSELALQELVGRGKGRGLDARRDYARILSAELALHTTSDFPLILANALNKMLLPEYEQAQPTYRMVAAQKPFNDFRVHNFIRKGDFPALLKVNEHGEFKYGTMGENNEPVTAATYGRIIGLSRQTLINDDLGAFADIAMTAARRVADFENALFFSTCITAGSGLGPALSDAVAVYDNAHGNVAAGSALSNTHLGEAYGKMMSQTSLDGLKLNVTPKILLTSPTSAVLAKTLLAAITPNQASQVNPFAGEMMAVADANLSGTRWYALADPAVLPNYIYGYIGGGGPRTEVRSGFEVDGVEFKVALDFGVGAIDYRGGVTGAGA